MYIHSFFRFLSHLGHLGHRRGLSRVLCAKQELLICSLFFSHSVTSNSLWPHARLGVYMLGLQHARLPCPSPHIIESVMPSNHLILCCPLLLLPSIFPSIRVFSNESALSSGGQSTRASDSASVPPMNIQGLIFRKDCWISLLSEGLSRVFSSTTARKNQLFSTQPFHCAVLTSIHNYWKNHSFD